VTDDTATAVDEPAVPPSTRDKLRAAKLPERTVELCLRGDLQAEWEDLHRQLAEVEARQAIDKRLNPGGERKQIAGQIETLEEQMRADTIVFRMRALSRKAWNALLKEHPPRKDDDTDAVLGYNLDTFMAGAIRACTYAPDDLDEETWNDLLDESLTEHQFASLQNAVLALNVRQVSVPNSSAASRILRASEPK
jgi:hypothetical protein